MGTPVSPALNEQAQPRRINTPSYDPLHHIKAQESASNEDKDKVHVRRAVTPNCEVRNVPNHQDGASREEKAKLDCIRTAEQVTNDEETPVRRRSTPSYSPGHRKRRGSAESADLPSTGKHGAFREEKARLDSIRTAEQVTNDEETPVRRKSTPSYNPSPRKRRGSAECADLPSSGMHKMCGERAGPQSPGNRKLNVGKGDTSKPGSCKSSAEKIDSPSSGHHKRGRKKEGADAEKLAFSPGNDKHENDKVEPRRSKTPSCEHRSPGRGRHKSIEEQANRPSRESLQVKL